MDNKQRLELARWAVGIARSKGADEVAINISNQRSIEIEYRDKKLENLKESTQNSLSISIYAQNKFSSHSTNDLRKETLEKLIAEGVASTRYMSEDKYRSLPDPKYYPKDLSANLDLMDADYDKVQSSDRLKIASAIEQAAMATSDKIISTSAGYNDTYYTSTKVQSNGFEGQSEGTFYSFGAEVTVKDGEAGRPEDYEYESYRFRKGWTSPEEIGRKAAKRALQKIGQKKFESGKYLILVENRVASRLLSMMLQPLTGRAIQQKSSYLDGMIGKQIASNLLTITDDPLIKQAMGSRLYDGEGLAAKRMPIIEKGILRNYYIDTYYGKKLEFEPTTSGPSNLVFEYGTRSLEQMIANMKRGILITNFLGGNSNPTTGDFSLGISGMLVENGAIVAPLNEMNISGNGKEFWNQLVELGNDPYPNSSIMRPSMLFDGINFSGI